MKDLVPGALVHAVLESGALRPVIVVEAINTEDERPSIKGVMFTLGREDGFEDFTASYQGRYCETADDDAGKRFQVGSWHWPQQTEPLPKPKPIAIEGGPTREGQSTPLPDDFPSKAALEAANILTIEFLRERVAAGTPEHPWYAEVPGIGETKAADVEAALVATEAKG